MDCKKWFHLLFPYLTTNNFFTSPHPTSPNLPLQVLNSPYTFTYTHYSFIRHLTQMNPFLKEVFEVVFPILCTAPYSVPFFSLRGVGRMPRKIVDSTNNDTISKVTNHISFQIFFACSKSSLFLSCIFSSFQIGSLRYS